jgi:hypothetical protein
MTGFNQTMKALNEHSKREEALNKRVQFRDKVKQEKQVVQLQREPYKTEIQKTKEKLQQLRMSSPRERAPPLRASPGENNLRLNFESESAPLASSGENNLRLNFEKIEEKVEL